MGGGLVFPGLPPDHAESVDATGVVFKRYLASALPAGFRVQITA